jgi:transcriptional regulator with GAF, ATPase, and Fis domain
LIRDVHLQANSEKQFRPTLSVSDPSGQLICRVTITRDVVSLASANADFNYVQFGSNVFFAELCGQGVFLSESSKPGEKILLPFGERKNHHGLCFTLTLERDVNADDTSNITNVPALTDLLTAWIGTPMQGHTGLVPALEEFLRLLVTACGALSGLLVLADERGYSLVTHFGTDLQGAEDIWNKMPASISEEVLRSGARMILPEGLREKQSPEKSTIYVRNVRSVVGFPLCAENRVLGIFYLNFQNILRDLSAELQVELEFAATLAGLVIQRALLREELNSLRFKKTSLKPHAPSAGRIMIGNSSALEDSYRFISRFSAVDIPILIMGETGTGKELAAREIHLRSSRSGKAFVSVNASAIPESLFESELFGHKKGAFTGAIADREGLVERAAGGTLFIDEIGEIPLPLQAKLLRVLQERTIVRVGDAQVRKVDFRLVAATHRDLKSMIKQGTFREDLYYRIAGGIVTLAPLRERRDDIRILAQFFKERFCEQHGLPQKEFSGDAISELLTYPWQGNIRELENAVSRAVVMSDGLVIRTSDFGMFANSAEGGAAVNPDQTTDESLEQAKERWLRGYLISALDRNNQNRTHTARTLGISERTLFRYLEALKIKDQNV